MIRILNTSLPDLPPCSASLWKPVWRAKAAGGETVAQLSGRSTYTDLDKFVMIADAVANLQLTAEDELLDIGCAAGFTGAWFAGNLRRYVGVDYNHGALVRFGYDKLVTADARALPFRDGEFSKTHMGSVLLCMSKDECFEALREMRRVTRNRGLVADTQIGPYDGKHDHNRVQWFESTDELAEMLIRAGWYKVEIHSMHRILPHSRFAVDAVVFPCA